MSTRSNLPAGVRAYDTIIENCCASGHRWEAPAISELGGVWYADEQHGWVCPAPWCDLYDVDADPVDDGGEPIMPTDGYVLGLDGVWRMPQPPEPDDELVVDHVLDAPEGTVVTFENGKRYRRHGAALGAACWLLVTACDLCVICGESVVDGEDAHHFDVGCGGEVHDTCTEPVADDR